MRKTFRPHFYKPVTPQFRVNREIQSAEVRLIDENEDNAGVVSTADALRRAEEAELDLVEVSPLAKPPVAKIMNFHQFKYKQGKEIQRQKSRQKKQETKGVRLSLRISQHDQGMRLEQAVRFLKEGNKLRVELPLRGRENQHQDLARTVIGSFMDQLKERHSFNIEQPLQKQGGRLSLICLPVVKTLRPENAATDKI